MERIREPALTGAFMELSISDSATVVGAFGDSSVRLSDAETS